MRYNDGLDTGYHSRTAFSMPGSPCNCDMPRPIRAPRHLHIPSSSLATLRTALNNSGLSRAVRDSCQLEVFGPCMNTQASTKIPWSTCLKKFRMMLIGVFPASISPINKMCFRRSGMRTDRTLDCHLTSTRPSSKLCSDTTVAGPRHPTRSFDVGVRCRSTKSPTAS